VFSLTISCSGNTITLKDGECQIQCVDVPHHFSKQKELLHFSNVCSKCIVIDYCIVVVLNYNQPYHTIVIRVCFTSVPIKLVFRIPSSMIKLLDEIHVNPTLNITRDDATGIYTADIGVAHRALVGHETHLLKLVMCTKFPMERVPLRMVPQVPSVLTYLLSFEVHWHCFKLLLLLF
jgi:hypothetical protein